jgi:hypothetical protein
MSAARGYVKNVNILSGVESAVSHSALIARLPSLAVDARRTSVLVTESRSLVAMNASTSVAASSAKTFMLVVVRNDIKLWTSR